MQYICSKCGKSKDESEYWVVKGYRRKECKRCALDIRNEYRRKRVKDYKKMAIDYLGGKCSKCGYDKCNRALEFHHKDRTTKKYEISKIFHRLSWEEIKKELDKCILVCSNCHREIEDSL